MNNASHASVEVALEWRSHSVLHTDRYYFPNVDLRRDVFPGAMAAKITQVNETGSVYENFADGELVPQYEPSNIVVIKASQFAHTRHRGLPREPLLGRFYPKGLLTGLAGIYSQDTHPFRYLGKDASGLYVDLNHPLAKAQYPIKLEASLVQLLHTSEDHRDHCNDIANMITENGPGLQAVWSDVETDFFSGNPFKREDDAADAAFYGFPRLVNHLDGAAMQRVTDIYARFLRPGNSVLDLMSSWNSHLPESIQNIDVVGVGLNREEMERNERLSGVVVHDLNRAPRLPFEQARFDNVICTVSVEYLTNPTEVFTEVARVLKPGGHFVVTYSERWFPPKVVALWRELHPFERVRLVLEYFRTTEQFYELQTESVRGLLRPRGDKYASLIPLSDPVYAVWGKRKPE